jgi:hypothetical protein
MSIIGKPFGLTTTTSSDHIIEGSAVFDGDSGELTDNFSTASDSYTKQTVSIWLKSAYETSDESMLFHTNVDGNNYSAIGLSDTSGDSHFFLSSYISGVGFNITATPDFVDPSAWYNLVVSFDSSVATPSSSSIRMWVNGVLQTAFNTETYPAQNHALWFSHPSYVTRIGSRGPSPDDWFDGYMAEFAFIVNQALDATSFGEFDSNGVWIPIDTTTLTFGNNGFLITGGTDMAAGTDSSGNSNSFTKVATVTATKDSPTDSADDGYGNYATLLPIAEGNDNSNKITYSNGNLTAVQPGGHGCMAYGSIGVSSGKWAWEVNPQVVHASYTGVLGIGIASVQSKQTANHIDNAWNSTYANGYCYKGNGDKNVLGTDSTYGSAYNASNLIRVELNLDDDEVEFFRDDVSQGTISIITGQTWFPAWYNYIASDKVTFEFQSLTNTPTAGFKLINTANLPAPSITKPSDQFLPIVYEGDGGGQRVGNFIPFTDAYTVDNSCVFDDGDNDYLTRTPSGAGNRKTWTFSAWIKRGNVGIAGELFDAYPSTDDRFLFGFTSSDTIWILSDVSTTRTLYATSNAVFRNPSTWIHIMCVLDTTESASADRIKLFYNGVQQTFSGSPTYPSLNQDQELNNNVQHAIGRIDKPGDPSAYFDGYMAEVVFIDGTALTPSSFGQTDTSTNRWIPKDVSGLTFGTNGFYLEFGTAADLGDDTSGETNDWAEQNIAAANQTIDTPTKNYCTWNPLNTPSGMTFSNGNLQLDSTTNWYAGLGTMQISSGKWYWEVNVGTATPGFAIGVADAGTMGNATDAVRLSGWSYSYSTDQRFDHSSTGTAYAAPSTPSSGDVFQVALDMDNGTIFIGQNNTWLQSSNPSTGASPMFSNVTGTVVPGYDMNLTSNAAVANFGQTAFAYTAPTDFVALNQDNLEANTAGITGLSWIKNRDATDNHIWQDRSRGIYKYSTSSSDSAAEATDTNSVQRFLQQGVQIGNMDAVNTSAESLVLWQWANDGTSALNEEGTIDSTVMANTDSGFSIVKFEGTGANGTMGHGLGAIPGFVVNYNLDTGRLSPVYHSSLTYTHYLYINGNPSVAAQSDSDMWYTAPTSTLMGVGTHSNVNESGNNHVMYCWAEIEGYSKFGKYTGNGVINGPFIYTGFKPSFVLIKNITSAKSWVMKDGVRNPYNPCTRSLYCNLTNVESPDTDDNDNDINILANGFKVKNSGHTGSNTTDDEYVFMAWADNPFGGSGVAQAKAR